MRRTAGCRALPHAWLPLLLLLACCVPAHAQSFGRWWWEGRLGLDQRINSQTSNGVESGSRQDQLRFFSALNGYLYDPTIGDFRLEADVALLKVKNGRAVDTLRSGYGAAISVLPRGRYPLSLYARRRAYDHAGPVADDPLASLRLPDTVTTLGARFRSRRGKLRGLLVGFDRQTSDFVSEDSGRETTDNGFVDFARRGRRFDHRFRIEQRKRNFDTTGVATDDVTVTLEESARLAGNWRWELSGRGLSHDLESRSGSDSSQEETRLSNRFVLHRPNGDQFNIQIAAAKIAFNREPTVDVYGATVFYRWQLDRGWSIAPRATHEVRTAKNLSLSAPRIGLRVSRTARHGAFDTLFSGGASLGRLELSNSMESRDDANDSFDFSGSLGHGTSVGLRKELEVQVTRNALDQVRRPGPGIPVPGGAERLLEAHDRQRVRFRLDHAWESRTIGGWAEWRHSSSDRSSEQGDLDLDAFLGTMQLNLGRWGVDGSAGATRSTRTMADDDELRYLSGRVFWRPHRSLVLNASFRADHRTLEVAPDADGRWVDVGATLHIALVDIDLYAFNSVDSFDNSPDRERQGLRWSISRRFGGWLPIVTGTQRRGTIR